jgi:hypothetical protein
MGLRYRHIDGMDKYARAHVDEVEALRSNSQVDAKDRIYRNVSNPIIFGVKRQTRVDVINACYSLTVPLQGDLIYPTAS